MEAQENSDSMNSNPNPMIRLTESAMNNRCRYCKYYINHDYKDWDCAIHPEIDTEQTQWTCEDWTDKNDDTDERL